MPERKNNKTIKNIFFKNLKNDIKDIKNNKNKK